MRASISKLPKKVENDICIIGHGMTGFVLFAALCKSPKTRDLKVSIIDKCSFPHVEPEQSYPNELRTVALTETSERILQNVMNQTLLSHHPGFLNERCGHQFQQMTVRDMDSNVFSIPANGRVVGLKTLLRRSWKSIPWENDQEDNYQALSGSIQGIETCDTSGYSNFTFHPKDTNQPSLNIQTKLLIGCDGLRSRVRESMQQKALKIDYSQRAYVFSAKVNTDAQGQTTRHQSTCYQNFLDDGSIIAFLPTSSTTGNVVLSASCRIAKKIDSASSDTHMIHLINTMLHQRAPHDIPMIVELLPDNTHELSEKKVASFPLALNVVFEPTSAGKVLVGDAARSVHPLAGQGLNLGISDSAVLFDCIIEVIGHGGSLSTEVGELYSPRMKQHTWPMIMAIEASNSLFSSKNYWMRNFRKLGCGFINESSALQRLISSYASGKYCSTTLAE